MASYNFNYKGKTTTVTDVKSETNEELLAEVLFEKVSKWFGENFDTPDCDALVNMSDEEFLSHFKQID